MNESEPIEHKFWHNGDELVKEVPPSVVNASGRCQISIKEVSKVIVERSTYWTYGKTYVRLILNGCSNNLSMYTNTEAYVANDIKNTKNFDFHGEYRCRPVF